VNIIKDYYLKSDHKGACEYLLKESSKRWMKVNENFFNKYLNIIRRKRL